jgi:hypothetical protein
MKFIKTNKCALFIGYNFIYIYSTYSDHPQVSVTHVAIFRVVSQKIQICLYL